MGSTENFWPSDYGLGIEFSAATYKGYFFMFASGAEVKVWVRPPLQTKWTTLIDTV